MAVLHVACAADERYAPHAATMLHSVLEQRGALDVHAHLLHPPALRARTRSRLEELVRGMGGEITLHAIPDARVAGLPDMAARGITTTMWFRIFLPELLPREPRVLYLDCDVLALDDLGPLWATELGDAYVGAVTNVWEPWNLQHPARLGIAPGEYFNSGVLLLNLDAMRADGSTAQLQEYAVSGDLVWPDQDALNVVLGRRHVKLHPRWNAMNSVLAFPEAVAEFGEQAVVEARERPGLRHFEGPSVNKPWHLLCAWQDREAYRRHRRATPWPRYVPAGITPRNVWRRFTGSSSRAAAG